MTRTTTRAKAEAHEALYLRLAAALLQVSAIVARRPNAAVPDETRAIAEALLFDSRPFTSGAGFPAAATTSAGLASQLAQGKAALEMWEASHSSWNGECYVWRLTRGEREAALPIQRLRAKAKAAAHDPARRRHLDNVREMLWKRIDARFGEGYDQGYADAQQGFPNRKEESYPRRTVEG